MTENLQLMREARKSLESYWGLAVLVTLVYSIISAIFGGLENEIESLNFILYLVGILITAPIALGYSIFALNVSRNNNPEFMNLFFGFNQFGRVVLAYLIMMLLIIVGIILFIIPGIIAALGLSMTLFILADEPEISATDALQKSWNMMQGYKWKFFRLILRFIPWLILGFIMFLVGILFVVPWMQVTLAKFYEEIKEAPTLSS